MAAAIARRISERSGTPFSPGVAAAASTSSRWIAPAGPVPLTPSSSTPSSFASRRAAGDTRRPDGAGTGGTVSGAGATSAKMGSGFGASTGATSSPAPSMRARALPTGTLLPGSTSNSSSRPSSNTSTSIAPLSVSTTAMMSPCDTTSPGALSHSTSTPACISAPSEGMVKTPMRQRPMTSRTQATILGTLGRAASSRCAA